MSHTDAHTYKYTELFVIHTPHFLSSVIKLFKI